MLVNLVKKLKILPKENLMSKPLTIIIIRIESLINKVIKDENTNSNIFIFLKYFIQPLCPQLLVLINQAPC